MALPELDRVKALSRCIIVENIQQFRSCVSSFTSPLIIVAPADCRDAAGQAVGKGHHVFLSADAISIDTRDNLMHLSRPNRDAVEEGLIQNGLSRSKAQAAARDFGWSMPVLRRHFSLPSAKRPLWTEAKSASILIPLLFAGAWDENKKGDRDVIESLSAISYNDYVNLLRPLLTIDDSPILKV